MEEKLVRSKEELEQIVHERTQELKQALHVKSRFLAIMSHGSHPVHLNTHIHSQTEIRTPLSGVIGSLNLLKDSELCKKQQELVRIGTVCGEQLLVVINDILGKCMHVLCLQI